MSIDQTHIALVLGRANTGKSTLLNAILGRTDMFYTSKKAGRTQSLNFVRVGPEPGKLILVDAPGYGSRGRQDWGTLFSNYIETRKELRRIYILLNAKHGINSTDTAMLRSLNERCLEKAGTKFTLQAVLTKADCIPPETIGEVIPQMREQIFAAAPSCLPPIITSALMKPSFGLVEMRRSISEVCGVPSIPS